METEKKCWTLKCLVSLIIYNPTMNTQQNSIDRDDLHFTRLAEIVKSFVAIRRKPNPLCIAIDCITFCCRLLAVFAIAFICAKDYVEFEIFEFGW